MKVELIHITPSAEKHIAYCARVSSADQNNPNYEKLLAYCIKHGHWSIFEMASMCIDITTSRAIAQQILRHKSFSFQEFSQRYSMSTSIEQYSARRQDQKNRQNSVDDFDQITKDWFNVAQDKVKDLCMALYEEGLQKGIAKEQMRFILPLATTTRLMMHGTIRSWIHYISLREANGTQKEHAEIALACKEIFCNNLPTVAKALGWTNESKNETI